MGQMTGVLDAAPMVAGTQRRFYQPELDGLRFYAFLGVFVCHSLPFEGAFYRRSICQCRGCGGRLLSRARLGLICFLR